MKGCGAQFVNIYIEAQHIVQNTEKEEYGDDVGYQVRLDFKNLMQPVQEDRKVVKGSDCDGSSTNKHLLCQQGGKGLDVRTYNNVSTTKLQGGCCNNKAPSK